MKFLADEGVDFPVVQRLRTDGHEVLYVAEMDPGISDEEVLAAANEKNALLLTADKDFGEIVYRQKRIIPGVILIRLAGLSPSEKAEVVFSAIDGHLDDLKEAFTVISRKSVRLRKKPLR